MHSLPDLIARVTRFPDLCAALGELICVLEAALDGMAGPFVETEERIVVATRAVGVAAVTEALRGLDPGAARIVVDGTEYRRMSESTFGRYEMLDGIARVRRHLYREVGVRNGPMVDPIALRAGVIDGMTPCAAEAVGQLVQALPTREAHEVAGAMRRWRSRNLDRLGGPRKAHRSDRWRWSTGWPTAASSLGTTSTASR